MSTVDRFVELEGIDLSGEDGLFTVIIDQDEMTAVAESGEYEEHRKRIHYKLTHSHETLTELERKNLLNCLFGAGNYDIKTEKVYPVDIFLDGMYVKKISEESLDDLPENAS